MVVVLFRESQTRLNADETALLKKEMLKIQEKEDNASRLWNT